MAVIVASLALALPGNQFSPSISLRDTALYGRAPNPPAALPENAPEGDRK